MKRVHKQKLKTNSRIIQCFESACLYADPDPGFQKCPYGSRSKGDKQKFKTIFQLDLSKRHLKIIEINKQNINLSITKGFLLLFLTGSVFASGHADPDPEGVFMCGSVRIRNTARISVFSGGAGRSRWSQNYFET